MRIARGLNEISLRQLAAAVRPGGAASIELVFADGRRVRIARGADGVYLRALVASVGQQDLAHIELVFAGGADAPASRRTIRKETQGQ